MPWKSAAGAASSDQMKIEFSREKQQVEMKKKAKHELKTANGSRKREENCVNCGGLFVIIMNRVGE